MYKLYTHPVFLIFSSNKYLYKLFYTVEVSIISVSNSHFKLINDNVETILSTLKIDFIHVFQLVFTDLICYKLETLNVQKK